VSAHLYIFSAHSSHGWALPASRTHELRLWPQTRAPTPSLAFVSHIEAVPAYISPACLRSGAAWAWWWNRWWVKSLELIPTVYMRLLRQHQGLCGHSTRETTTTLDYDEYPQEHKTTRSPCTWSTMGGRPFTLACYLHGTACYSAFLRMSLACQGQVASRTFTV